MLHAVLLRFLLGLTASGIACAEPEEPPSSEKSVSDRHPAHRGWYRLHPGAEEELQSRGFATDSAALLSLVTGGLKREGEPNSYEQMEEAQAHSLALDVLACRREQAVLEGLREVWKGDPNGAFGRQALVALAGLGNEEALETVRGEFERADPHEKARLALRIAYSCESPEAEPFLRAALDVAPIAEMWPLIRELKGEIRAPTFERLSAAMREGSAGEQAQAVEVFSELVVLVGATAPTGERSLEELWSLPSEAADEATLALFKELPYLASRGTDDDRSMAVIDRSIMAIERILEHKASPEVEEKGRAAIEELKQWKVRLPRRQRRVERLEALIKEKMQQAQEDPEEAP